MPGKCEYCKREIKFIDYKDAEHLKKFLTPKGKIVSRRYSKLCAYHQKRVALAIKRARQMALLPFVESYYY